jgi:hypothetical protein
MADTKKPELRLLKVVVQPVMVVDDGTTLQEVPVDPIVVPANEWPTYPTNRFQEQLKALQQQLAETVESQAKKAASKK